MLRFPLLARSEPSSSAFASTGAGDSVLPSSLSAIGDHGARTARRGDAAGDILFKVEILAMDKRACFERVRCEIHLL